jgi:hypothetical protein
MDLHPSGSPLLSHESHFLPVAFFWSVPQQHRRYSLSTVISSHELQDEVQQVVDPFSPLQSFHKFILAVSSSRLLFLFLPRG